MAWEVLPIAEGHIAGFHSSLDRVARERRYLAFLEAPPMSETEAFVRQNIAQRNPQFVAVETNTVIGWCDITPMERLVFAHRGSLGMGVIPEFRGKGIGRRLIEVTLAAARAKGLARIDLQVREDNIPAVSLYERVGFVIEGVHRNAYSVDGSYFNLVSMALSFDAIA
jgi:ribosomal protein S18 acetylase RimI-like enzyme